MVTPLRDLSDSDGDSAADRPAAAPVATPAAAPSTLRYRSGYSRFVLLMKLALPVVAALVVVLVVIWPELRNQSDSFRIGVSDLQVESAGGQRLVNARFTGVDADNRPFAITADTVQQEGDADRGRFELNEPKADVTLEDNRWVALASPAGTYWRDTEILDLRGGVDLFHDDGYQFRTEEVRIDFAGGTATGDVPVHGQGPFGTINGEGLNILDAGDRIIFTGKSRLVLYPDAPRPGTGSGDGR